MKRYVKCASVSDALRQEIYEYLDECFYAADYNQAVEDVAETFNISEDDASGVVWDWTIEIDYDKDEE